MQKISRIGRLGFLILIFLFQLSLQAQNKKYFVISGQIVPEEKGTSSGVIEITKNAKETSNVEIPKNGRFRLELEFFNEYYLNFKYPGHFSKIIVVNTDIPQEVWARDNDFPPFPMVVQLLKEFEGVDKSFTLKPTGRIFYGKDIDNFQKEGYIADIQFVEQIETAKTKATQVQKEADLISKESAQDVAAKQKNFDQLIKEADANYQRGEYPMALAKYLDAQKLFPDKKYPNDRVAELQDLVKALEITERQKAELEQKYKAAIAKANGFFDQKSYLDARPVYQEALQYKPGDVYSNGRINEIDQLLALLEKQKQYKDLVAQADINYKLKNYDQAIVLYNQAKLAVPAEQYPQNQINQISQDKLQLANQEQLDKDFNQAIQAANTQVQQKDYLQALNSYKKALGLKPDNKLAKDKIAEMEQAIVAVETDSKYQQAIKLADQALASNNLDQAKIQYQEALKLKSGETYPKTKLAEITKTEAGEIKFNELVASADKAFTANNFDESLNLYTQALEIKPKDPTVQKRIDDIQNLKKQQLNDKEYTDLIAQADQSFRNDQLDASLSSYNKALQIKKTEAYPNSQIKRIETYQSLIKQADKLLGAKDYSGSTGSYNDALAQKPNDSYALGKIAEIGKILEEKKQLEEKQNAELTAYNEAIKNADQLFTAQNYPESLNKYKEAAGIKTSETYPKKRIKEVENILDGLEKEKARIEKDYLASIAQADKLLEKKDYTNSQAEYRKALVLKPDETYPKEQILKIDQALAENKKLEEENLRLQKEKQDQAFNQAMASGDKSFSGNDFEAAKTGYQTALTIKPNDPTAKDKLGQAEAKLLQLAQMTAAYNKAIGEADKQLTDKKYKESKVKYQEAQQYQSGTDYPKLQIAKIDEILAQQEAVAKTQQEFNLALADGEALLKNKDLTKAKDAFTKASNLIPAETVPPKRIAEINALLELQARKDAELKATLDAYQAAVQKADKQLGNKEYSLAQKAYNEALLIKSDEKYPVDQLALIDKLLKDQIEQNYKTAIDKADNAFTKNQLDEAVTAYQDALTYKKNDQYATKRLKDIDQKKADIEAENIRLKKLQDQFNGLVADADKDFGNKDYQNAKEKYQKATVLKPEEAYPKSQILKIDQTLAENKRLEEENLRLQKEKQDQAFNQAMASGDKSFAGNDFEAAKTGYQTALTIKPNDPTAKDKLGQAEAKLLQLAQMIAAYNKAIGEADKQLTNKKYLEAKAKYQEAQQYQPGTDYPKLQIAKIDELLAKQEAEAKTQQEFDLALADGEALLKNKELTKAKDAFTKAYNLIPAETVPPKRIAEISAMLVLQAQKDAQLKATLESYQAAIQKADKQFGNKEYDSAKLTYNEALQIKSDEKYPVDQLALIEKMVKDQVEQNYKTAIAKADIAFTSNQFDEATSAYQDALTYKKNDQYATKRLKDIDQKKADIEAENIRQKKLQDQFNGLIADADKDFGNRDYQNAKEKYQKATVLKPDEAYPKSQILKIDQTLAENKRLEEENQRLQKEKQDQAFNQAMASGDKSFAGNDFEAAKTGYQNALTIKPNDPTAKEKFGQAEAKLAQLAQMTLAYNKAIGEANKQLTDKKYKEAKAKYQEAQQYQPETDYPKLQIAKIDELLAKQEAEVKTQQEFDLALADGETLLKNKELTKAKDAFMKAYNLIPSETVPPKRIAEINALLALQAQKESELKATLESYQAAIQKADKQLGIKDYNLAKLVYNEALLIKPDEKYPVDQLALIDKLIVDQNDQNYKTSIAKADNAFTSSQFDVATTSYQEALTYKKNDVYATNRLKEIELKKGDAEAEKIRLKKLQDDYNAMIADAGNDFMKKEYQKSKEKYQKALTLKPEEVLPKEQIAKIDQILSDLQKAEEINRQYAQAVKTAQDAFGANKLKEARDAYQIAATLKPYEPMPPMKISEIDNMLGQLDEAAQLAAQEKASRLAKEKADRDLYEKEIATGDQSFAGKQYVIARSHYNSALIAISTEKYPRDQIAKIDELLSQEEKDKALSAQKAQQDSLKKANDKLFDLAMAAAQEYEQNKRYEQAIQKYTDAIQIKPDQKIAIQKLISDIQEKMQLLAKQEAEYRRIIKLADDYFTDSKLNEALTEYGNALTIKADEDYPKKQIEEIQKKLKLRDENYSALIKNADKAFDASDWENAKTGYTDALEIKPNEIYPANRLKEVNQKISDAKLAAISNSAENKAYKNAIEKAEKSFQDDQLPTARMQFQEAQTIKPDEKLPAERIKEIDVLIDKRNKEKLAQAQREIDEKYRQAISVADNSFREKTYDIAKLQYKQASIIKPDEAYPKTQMDLIDKLLREAKPVETYVAKLPEPEPAKPVVKPLNNPIESAQATEARAQSFNPIVDYDEVVKKADVSFGIKDYSVARFFYLKASDIKPKEEYPKTQIELIRKLIDSQLSSNDVSEYENNITQGDAAFAKQNYSGSKFFYYKALEIKSWEKYPKDRINEIDALTHSLLSEKEEKAYRDIIAKADEAYFNKDISIARFYYNKAISIKKDENYPRIKLKDIQKLIEQDKRDQENLTFRKLIDDGDQALKLENFSIARFSYNKALEMKPDEKYPKDQLKLIKEALDKKKN